MSERGGRYPRSFSGLVGALVITLLVIAAYVGFRALNRNDVSVRPDPIDLAGAVQLAQSAGLRPVRPEPLPDGWSAISFEALPEQAEGGPAWGLGLHTQEGRFVGVRLERSSVDSLVERYVDEDAEEGDVVPLDSSVGGEWTEWTDHGGDVAYATEHRGMSLLVWGSAPVAEVRGVIGDLTDARVTPDR